MTVNICSYSDRREAIDTTSRSKNWSRGLSPFYLGPCKLYENYVSRNVENGWQYSKVYAKHSQSGIRVNCDYHIEYQDGPTEEYFKWAELGWSKQSADRYPMGKGVKPLYSWWDGEQLDYVTARKFIYVPLYARSVVQSDAWKKLKQLYEECGEICLRDFDGYDYIKQGVSFQEAINNPDKKMGHAFVLAMLLTSKTRNLKEFLDEVRSY